MKKIILAIIVVAAVWFIGVWQAGRIAMNTLEEQSALVAEETLGAYEVEIEWTEKGWNFAKGVLTLQGLPEGVLVSQLFTLDHGFFKSNYHGVLNAQFDGYSLVDLYGEEGVVTHGNFSLGGFALSLNVAELNFSEDGGTISHSPFQINVAGNGETQRIEGGIEDFSIQNDAMGEVFFYRGMVLDSALEYDRQSRVVGQDISFVIDQAGISNGRQEALLSGLELAVDFQKQGPGVSGQVRYGVESLELQETEVGGHLAMNFAGGDFDLIWSEYETLMDYVRSQEFQTMSKGKTPQMNLPDEFQEIYEGLMTALLTDNLTMNVNAHVTENPWFGQVDVDMTYTGPNRDFAGENEADALHWMLDGQVEGVINGVPHHIGRTLNQQFGLNSSTYPWPVTYNRESGLRVGEQNIIPPNAIPAPK